MSPATGATESVDAYIATFPESTRAMLELLRTIIHEEAPAVEEKIAYDIPTFALDGRNLVHVAGWKRYVSIYPVPLGDAAFEAQVAPCRSGRSTVRFKLGTPVPVALVRQAVGLLLERRQT